MDHILPKKRFSVTGTLGGKNDVDMTFDDSYMFCVNNIDIFALVFSNETNFF